MLGTYPNQNRYNWAQWLIWANMFWAIISICIEAYGLWLVKHAEDASELTLDTFDSATATTGWIQFALLITSGLVFLNWWGKSRENLWRLGAVRSTANTSTAQASWIIPIVSWWVPYQHTQEMVTGGSGGEAPPTMLPWWIAWVVYGLSSRVAGRIYKHADTAQEFMHGLQVSLLSDICLIAAGVWLLPVMAAIHQRQSRLAAQQSAERRGLVEPQLGHI